MGSSSINMFNNYTERETSAKAESGELDQVFLVHDKSPSSAFGCVYLVRLPNVGAVAVDIPAMLVMQCV